MSTQTNNYRGYGMTRTVFCHQNILIVERVSSALRISEVIGVANFFFLAGSIWSTYGRTEVSFLDYSFQKHKLGLATCY